MAILLINSMEPEEEVLVCEVVAAGLEAAGFTVLQLVAMTPRTTINMAFLNIFSTNKGTVK
jgi:hypothetical protein